MFTRRPAASQKKPASSPTVERPSILPQSEAPTGPKDTAPSDTPTNHSIPAPESQEAAKGVTRKRSEKSDPPPASIPVKRSKSAAQVPGASAAGQQTLKGFFKPKSLGTGSPNQSPTKSVESTVLPEQPSGSPSKAGASREPTLPEDGLPRPGSQSVSANDASQSAAPKPPASQENDTVIDPVASKEDWSKLFSKKSPPKCEHQEHCISLTTKKPGINCGRAFWLCPRPLGPSGNKEKGTEWRCATFIWASDWNTST